MVKQRPLTPPSLDGRDLQYGFYQLMQHNAATQYQPDHYTLHENAHLQSGSNTTLSSPEPNQLPTSHYGTGQYHGGYQGQYDPGLSIQHDGYDGPIYYQDHNNEFHALPGQQNYLHSGWNTSTPPTPTASDHSGAGRRTTRSGHLVVPSRSGQRLRANTDDRSRASSSPKARKAAKQTKGDKSKVPKINAPLSELTKTYTHIPIRDMDEWVNRTAETRRLEVEKRNGYITRPMNSFMLYRSAYAERTKMWCLQNNHQIVSSVSGESWPLEPSEVREQYNEYARIERDNHQKAHPGYKFSPSKAQNSSRKRKGASQPEEEEPSDLDDADFSWKPSSGRKTRAKQMKRPPREGGYPTSNGVQDNPRNRGPDPYPRLNQSSYQATNPGRPLAATMSGQDLYGQYYQTTVYPNSREQNIEDVFVHKTETTTNITAAPPLIGLPGAYHYELLGEHSVHNSPAPTSEPQVDPVLLAYDNNYLGQASASLTEQQFRDLDHNRLFDAGSQPSDYYEETNFHPQTDPWQLDNESGHNDSGAEFDRWMEANNNR